MTENEPMTLNSNTWQLLCRDVPHKQVLFDLAAASGLKLTPSLWGYRDDAHLFISYWPFDLGLGSLPSRYQDGRGIELISEMQFRGLCMDYAHDHQVGEQLLATLTTAL